VTGLLQAPADRPAGKRGIRGLIAAVASVGALFSLSFTTNWDDPSWGKPALLAVGAALTAAAVLLWVARHPALLAAAAALLVAATGVWVVADSARRSEQREEDKWGGASFDYDDKGPAITRAEAEAVPIGASKDEVKRILGPAAGSGIQRVNDGEDLRCRAYRAEERPAWKLYALCFTGDRYTDLREW